MANTSTPAESRLLALPQEMQDMIQEEVFDEVVTITVDKVYRAPALLRALRTNSNQGIFKRALETYYKTTTFKIPMRELVKWLRQRSTHAKHIRNVHVVPRDGTYEVDPRSILHNPNTLFNYDQNADEAGIAGYRLLKELKVFGTMAKHFRNDWFDREVKRNLNRAQTICNILLLVHEKFVNVGLQVHKDSFKMKLQTASGEYLWTAEPDKDLQPLLERAGYAKKVREPGSTKEGSDEDSDKDSDGDSDDDGEYAEEEEAERDIEGLGDEEIDDAESMEDNTSQHNGQDGDENFDVEAEAVASD